MGTGRIPEVRELLTALGDRFCLAPAPDTDDILNLRMRQGNAITQLIHGICFAETMSRCSPNGRQRLFAEAQGLARMPMPVTPDDFDRIQAEVFASSVRVATICNETRLIHA